jgi:hypothetical protein
MSEQYRKIVCRVNADTMALVDAAGYAVSRRDDLPRLVANDRCVIELRMLEVGGDAEPAPYGLPIGMTYGIIGDCDYAADTPLMFKTVGLLDDSDPAAGVLRFLINTNTMRFREAVSDTARMKYELIVFGIPAGETAPGILAKMPFAAENRIDENGEPEPPEPGDYLTAAETQALFRAKFELRFSVDGIDFHAGQTESDRYFQFRHPGGAWSDPIQLPAGARGMPGPGYRPRGAYDAAVIYERYDTVTDQGCLWCYIHPVPGNGNAPPIFPEAENDFWLLLISRGATGHLDRVMPYNVTSPYAAGQVVGSGGSTYQALEPIDAGESPLSVPARWQLLAGRGENGGWVPYAERTYAHATYGSVAYLDAGNVLVFMGYEAEGVNRIELWLVSADPEVTGNIVLRIGAERFVVPVAASPAKATLCFSSPVIGIVTIVRDTGDPDDHVVNSAPVTVFAISWRMYGGN